MLRYKYICLSCDLYTVDYVDKRNNNFFPLLTVTPHIIFKEKQTGK